MEIRVVTCAAAPTPEQAAALKQTMQAVNAACNFVSAVAWEQRVFTAFALQPLVYQDLRQRFGLPSQLAIRAIAKVADAYKTSKETQAEFRPLGSITYDSRVLRLIGVSNVSCSTLAGRVTVKLNIGGYQRDRLSGAALGETKLTYTPEKHRFCFVFSVKIDPPPGSEPEGFLGVDLGRKNIAADSDGTLHPPRGHPGANSNGCGGSFPGCAAACSNSERGEHGGSSTSGANTNTAELPTSTTTSPSNW
jgi:putative transposase